MGRDHRHTDSSCCCQWTSYAHASGVESRKNKFGCSRSNTVFNQRGRNFISYNSVPMHHLLDGRRGSKAEAETSLKGFLGLHRLFPFLLLVDLIVDVDIFNALLWSVLLLQGLPVGLLCLTFITFAGRFHFARVRSAWLRVERVPTQLSAKSLSCFYWLERLQLWSDCYLGLLNHFLGDH